MPAIWPKGGLSPCYVICYFPWNDVPRGGFRPALPGLAFAVPCRAFALPCFALPCLAPCRALRPAVPCRVDSQTALGGRFRVDAARTPSSHPACRALGATFCICPFAALTARPPWKADSVSTRQKLWGLGRECAERERRENGESGIAVARVSERLIS